mgnify:CR=1 FL=1
MVKQQYSIKYAIRCRRLIMICTLTQPKSNNHFLNMGTLII